MTDILYLTSGRATLLIVFFKKILAISVYFLFQMNFRINMSSSIKNPFGILIGSALNLQINLGRIDIFTLLNLPIQEHGMPLHFFRCSFMSFSKILSLFFFPCRSYIFLVRFIPGYFLLLLWITSFLPFCTLFFQFVIASKQEILIFFYIDLTIYLIFSWLSWNL